LLKNCKDNSFVVPVTPYISTLWRTWLTV
jgi:hypothetical protein